MRYRKSTEEARDMKRTQLIPPTHDPIELNLSPADDRVLLNDWLPPQVGVVPKIRIGRRWINVLWTLPLGFVLAVMGVAVAQALRELPAVQDFLVRYPGVPPSAHAVTAGFPVWLRLQHFLNLLFMGFIIRAGIQVLADHPRLYWKRDCTPGTEWFRFQKAVPTGRIWTAKDDSVTLPGLAGYPRHSALHRACPLVAFLVRPVVDHQWHRRLRAAVLDWAMGEACAEHVGGVPERTLHGVTVPFPHFPR